MNRAQQHRASGPTRRRVLAGLLASVALPGGLQAEGSDGVARPASLHILPQGLGKRNGADWDNAAPLKKADRLLRKALPGQHLLFGFPQGKDPFAWSETRMRWKGGGTAEAPLAVSFGAPDGTGAVRPGTSLDDPPCLTLAGVDPETADGRSSA